MMRHALSRDVRQALQNLWVRSQGNVADKLLRNSTVDVLKGKPCIAGTQVKSNNENYS